MCSRAASWVRPKCSYTCAKQAMQFTTVGQTAGSNLKMGCGSLEITSLEKTEAHRIMGPGRLGLQFDRLMQVLDGFGILFLLGQGHAQTVLREIDVGLPGEHFSKCRDRFLRFSFIQREHGLEGLIGNRDGASSGRFRKPRRPRPTLTFAGRHIPERQVSAPRSK